MRRRLLISALVAVTAAPALAVDPVTAFPRANWFREHFAQPRTRVELQAPRRLSEFVAGGKLELSLRAFIELALANNTDIALAKLQVESPVNSILRAYSPFD